MGIDVWEVIEAAKTKPFGFTPFYPGPGLGGHCIPIDPFYLTWKAAEFGVRTRFIELAGEINTSMPATSWPRSREALNGDGKSVKGSRVLVLGLSYKAEHRRRPRVADVRADRAARALWGAGGLLRSVLCRGATDPQAGRAQPAIGLNAPQRSSRSMTACSSRLRTMPSRTPRSTKASGWWWISRNLIDRLKQVPVGVRSGQGVRRFQAAHSSAAREPWLRGLINDTGLILLALSAAPAAVPP